MWLAGILWCWAPVQLFSQKFSAAFYNVENLFDTIDAPLVLDEDFTPAGKLRWTTERYLTKLDRIAEVVEAMEFPMLLGVAEVENRQVLEDLLDQHRLRRCSYRIVHADSPDERGIDVALLFDSKQFKCLGWDTLRIHFPDSLRKNPDLKYSTRDVLFVHLRTRHKPRQVIWVGVVHAPSRSGGVEATEPLRLFVAAQIRNYISRLQSTDPHAAILLMGDFNDDPDSPSLRTALQAACPGENAEPALFYNLTCPAFHAGLGTYNYRGTWNMLDQFIASASLIHRWKNWTAQPFRLERMMFAHDRFGPMPNRTYGGPNYYGGYSDHLPILLQAEWVKQKPK